MSSIEGLRQQEVPISFLVGVVGCESSECFLHFVTSLNQSLYQMSIKLQSFLLVRCRHL